MKHFPILITTIIALCDFVYSMDGEATYYNQGLTACGQAFKDTDLVAAVAPNHWKPGGNPNNDPICHKSAKVTDKSNPQKSVTVRIKDKCMGCKPGDIDLSPAAFKKLRDLSVGRFAVKWNFV